MNERFAKNYELNNMKKKSWTDKLFDSKDLPKVVELNEKGSVHWGGQTMVIPRPLDVFNLMAQVPEGKVTTITEIRKALAKKYKTDIACPLTTGIFSTISARASEENNDPSKLPKIPYWRTLKSSGEINEKFPGGVEVLSGKLKAEGFEVIHKGKKAKVKDYEKYLFHSDDFEL
ncbi:MAG: MGMT family protein [Ignavibacteria bacterium]|nr:MGMT family protein [Ignavibacteria bacterium]